MNDYVNPQTYLLSLEVTRRCNGGKLCSDGKVRPCAHCFRGNPQNVDMSEEVIKAIAQSDFHCEVLLFSGGEPTLVPEIIDKVLKEIKDCHESGKGLYYDSTFLVTNGMEYSEKIVEIFDREYLRQLMHPGFYAPDFGIAMSVDSFHDYHPEVHEKYKKLPYYSTRREVFEKGQILNEGLAKENGLGTLSMEPVNFSFWSHTINFRSVYINVFGDVLLNGDCSYESQEKMKLGNILERPLREILEEFARKNLTSEELFSED